MVVSGELWWAYRQQATWPCWRGDRCELRGEPQGIVSVCFVFGSAQDAIDVFGLAEHATGLGLAENKLSPCTRKTRSHTVILVVGWKNPFTCIRSFDRFNRQRTPWQVRLQFIVRLRPYRFFNLDVFEYVGRRATPTDLNRSSQYCLQHVKRQHSVATEGNMMKHDHPKPQTPGHFAPSQAVQAGFPPQVRRRRAVSTEISLQGFGRPNGALWGGREPLLRLSARTEG